MENLKEIQKELEKEFNTEIKDGVLLVSEKINVGDWCKTTLINSIEIIGKFDGMIKHNYKLKEVYNFQYGVFIDNHDYNIVGKTPIKLTQDQLFDYFKQIAVAKGFVKGNEFKGSGGNWFYATNDFTMYYFDKFAFKNNDEPIYTNGIWAEVRKIQNEPSEIELLKEEVENLKLQLEYFRGSAFTTELLNIAKNKELPKKERLKEIIKKLESWQN